MASIMVFAPDGELLLEVRPDGLAIGPMADEYMRFIETYTHKPKGSVRQEGKLIDIFVPVSVSERPRAFFTGLKTAGCRIEERTP